MRPERMDETTFGKFVNALPSLYVKHAQPRVPTRITTFSWPNRYRHLLLLFWTYFYVGKINTT